MKEITTTQQIPDDWIELKILSQNLGYEADSFYIGIVPLYKEINDVTIMIYKDGLYKFNDVKMFYKSIPQMWAIMQALEGQNG